MMFNIATELNDPFGYDINDVKLNQIAAQSATDILKLHTEKMISRSYLIDAEHETATWLEDFVSSSSSSEESMDQRQRTAKKDSFTRHIIPESMRLVIPFILFIAWSSFIIFLTWKFADDNEGTTRWWKIYIPLDTSTVSYVSVAIFLLIGFWMSDAYLRYWRALEIWQSVIPPLVDDLSFNIMMAMREGMWHQRDHERILSHIAAVPYIAKQFLRDSSDFSELRGMLSDKDILKVNEANNPIDYVFGVINAYIYTADAAIGLKRNIGEAPNDNSFLVTMYNVQDYEYALRECQLLRDIPTPKAFTSHLYIGIGFWLALLPLTLVLHDGFLSFLYLVPIGYSILKLVDVGSEMSDPFGTDVNDLPMDTFCEEQKRKIQALYRDSRGGFPDIVKDTGYDRSNFIAREDIMAGTDVQEEATGPTIRKSLMALYNKFPHVSPYTVLFSLLWSIISVVASHRLSFRWSDPVRENCAEWCSPVDVKGDVLGNVGFALFMILGFRASDALDRYRKGAELLSELRLRVRSLSLDFAMYFEDDEFHPNFKERVVAHIAQIPICFRNMMIGKEAGKRTSTLLNAEDFSRYENAASPMEYLLQTIGTYITLQDCSFLDEYMDNGRKGHSAIIFTEHVQVIRQIIAKAVTVKRFPVIKSYTDHQNKFTLLWLILLPLSMTSSTGYFTILWAPIISYCILCLESITVKLVDPYGTDSIDLPIEDICTSTCSDVLEAVASVEWGVKSTAHETPVDSIPNAGSLLQDGAVAVRCLLPSLYPTEGDPHLGSNASSPRKPRPTLYAHLLRSVPWWTIVVILVWTVVGCVISYVFRDLKAEEERWWKSNFSVTTNVGTNISFVAFTLLGFYVDKAFDIYRIAGEFWTSALPKYCHLLTSYMLTFIPRDQLHVGDHERLVGHIAALPIVLKQELRDSCDLCEIQGLLSTSDIGKIHAAPSMSQRCLDVILAYWNAFLSRPMIPKHDMTATGTRTKMARSVLNKLALAVNESKFVKDFPMSPGFITVLNSLLGLFFLVLPFILAPLTGWLTILWTSIVAYGVMGMYRVAEEIQNPYGTDLNDLDLDQLANQTVSEVIFVFRQQRDGHRALISEQKVPHEFWQAKLDRSVKFNIFDDYDRLSLRERVFYNIKLAMNAVLPWVLGLTVMWAGIAVSVAYVISKYLPQNDEGKDVCKPWFCSAIALDSAVSSYIGFALFLLLGLFLYDSHWRYVHGISTWRGELTGKMRTTTNFLFQAYYSGYWHRGDLERVGGHLAASVICLKSDLQGSVDVHRLRQILSENDVGKILNAPCKMSYCLDVVRAYLTYSELLDPSLNAMDPVRGAQTFYIGLRTMLYSDPLVECKSIVAVPLPFGYVQHLRIFLTIWIILLPFGIVESAGWTTILWVPLISYGMLGIERWAEKLSDPFGTDVTDLPLNCMTDEIVGIIRTNLQLFDKGVESFVQRNRNVESRTVP